ncbi:hypothetical protein Taro_008494 [Colocasia esculenta]|uniref:Uncharacterized protein n=1 Tax=Colocasia esculenta TaxID=4460 RepID=A0A843U2H1_COLES|nr:hypothetical protein [Colocasia esculenta]
MEGQRMGEQHGGVVHRHHKEKKEEAAEPEVDPERDQRTVLVLKADERDVYEFFYRAGKRNKTEDPREEEDLRDKIRFQYDASYLLELPRQSLCDSRSAWLLLVGLLGGLALSIGTRSTSRSVLMC